MLNLNHPEDRGVLTYLDDDGTLVEPEFYVPIIPMILVNGTTGIGTGFSTDIMCYNPAQIVSYIQKRLNGESTIDCAIEPYYEGFKGEITKIEDDKYLFKGCYEVVNDDVIHITELPVGTWTESYKEFLEKQLEPDDKKGKSKRKKVSILKDYKDMSTDTTVDITVTFQKGTLKKLLEKENDYGCNELENVMKLTTTRKTSNMHLFDENQRLRKFTTPQEIVDHYIPIRTHYYKLRKEHLIQQLEKEVMLLSNKARFIEEQCEDVIDLRRKKKDDVVALLETRKYDKIDDDEYKYLRSMPIDSVIEENIVRLRSERDKKMEQLEVLKTTTLETMWMDELGEFETHFTTYRKMRLSRQKGVSVKRVIKKKTKKSKK